MKYLMLIFLMSSCNLVNKVRKSPDTDNLKCNITEITEFDNSYRFTAVDDLGNMVLIISSKDNHQTFKSKIIDTISLHKRYNFKVTQIKPRVSTMEQLGAFIIIESDTLWKAPTYKDIPPTYLAHNTTGLFFMQK